jgi:hypothetical protein
MLFLEILGSRVRSEPALVAGFLQALLALLLAFGVPLTDVQVAAILGLSAALLAFVVRSRVTPVK